MQQRMLAIPRFAITGVKTYESTCCMGMCYPPEKNITLITKEMRASYRPNRCAYAYGPVEYTFKVGGQNAPGGGVDQEQLNTTYTEPLRLRDHLCTL
mmetsp:Transcript_4000/g.8509  ORF Transcript_4000/g.8509 Transcript_4000/m.8509 type:complete len:97 (+) Transcript_4000:99-389(+)